MRKLLASVYGEKAVDILSPIFEKLTDEQKYNLMGGVVDVLQDTSGEFEDITDEQQKIILESSLERAIEIMPGLKDRLEEEVKEVLEEF